MKLAAAALVLLVTDSIRAAPAPFPRKPIKIMVYTAPGGLLDMMARKFADVAKTYTDATFVVENKTGAGGIVAIERVLQLPADGYTLCASTKSSIAKVVSANRSAYLDELHWVALLMKDRECIITRQGGPLRDWPALLADARRRTAPQIWLGPATGGQDHVFAMKCWDAFDMSAVWVPFSSGGEAVVSLLGDQGTAYVGSPRDAKGNSDLRPIVVSSPQRLPKFPQTPTFAELGVPQLDNEYMWRGFALKRQCPPNVLKWYDELFRRVTADDQWRSFWEESGTEVAYESETPFTDVVHRDRDEFLRYMQRLGMIQSREPAAAGPAHYRLWIWGLPLCALLVALIGIARRTAGGRSQQPSKLAIPALLFVAGLTCLTRTLAFPSVTGNVGPAAVPRMWALMLLPLCLYTYLTAAQEASERPSVAWRTDLVWWFLGLLAAYAGGTCCLGYYLSTAAFLVAAMFLLGLRDLRTAGWVTAGWLLFAGVAFAGMLYVPLPAGMLYERFLRGE